MVDRVNRKSAYCIQADLRAQQASSKWTDANTKPDAQRLAWLTSRYNGDVRTGALFWARSRASSTRLDPMGDLEYLKGIGRIGWKDNNWTACTDEQVVG